MKLDQKFLDGKIFKLEDGGPERQSFRFVVLKVCKIYEELSQSEKIIVQIIDMSDKILYNEVKAEQSFLALINATVSHELRNPLSSMVGQIDQMKSYF